MELDEIKIGLRVEVKKLGDTKGMMIKKEHGGLNTMTIRSYVFDEFEKE
jgi:hypothetical protein